MRKGVAVLISTLVACTVARSNAQELATTLGIFYGGSEPWREAGSYYGHDYFLLGLRAGLENLVVTEKGGLGLQLDLAYLPWKMKSGREGYKSTILVFALRGAYNLGLGTEGKLRVGPTVGAGLYPISYSVPSGEQKPKAQTSLGICFGGGLGYRLGEATSLGFEVVHHIAFTNHVGVMGGNKLEGNTPFTMVTVGLCYVLPKK